jgi:hypothetical protein
VGRRTSRGGVIRRTILVTAALVTGLVTACGDDGGLPQGSDSVTLAPAEFTTEIDNPYLPMTPGDHWVYRETDVDGTEQRVEVTVTGETKTILGIEAVVVHDVATEDGEVIEDTYDWYAQDGDGNVWYLGEDTKELENGEVTSTAGSWEAGVDGAQPGIAMPADPAPGLTYRQEYYAGEAEDAARVLSVDELVSAPFGSYDEALLTRDFTPVEPDVVEYKLYARGVGLVLAVAVSGGSSREELTSFERG